VSKKQLNILGDRLRRDSRAEADLRSLDDYRLTFVGALASVREALQAAGIAISDRLKSKKSIVEKLRRGTTQLTQIQDVAGCPCRGIE